MNSELQRRCCSVELSQPKSKLGKGKKQDKGCSNSMGSRIGDEKT